MSNPEAAALSSTTIRDTLPPASPENLEQPLANAKEASPAEQQAASPENLEQPLANAKEASPAEQQAASPEEAFQSREEAQIALAKQVLAYLNRSGQLSHRKQKKLAQCVDTMEKQIQFREENVRRLPNLLHLQTETHRRGLVLKETINMHTGAVERSSKKIRSSRKTFRKITKGPLKRANRSFEPQNILPTITED